MLKIIAFIFPLLAFSYINAQDCQKADLLYQQGVNEPLYEAKINIYKQVIELCPQHYRAHNNLADAYEHLGQYHQAIKEYQKASELAPDFAIPLFGMGDVYMALKDYQKAIEFYQKGLKLKPDDQKATLGLQFAKIKLKSLQEGEITSDDFTQVVRGVKGIHLVVPKDEKVFSSSIELKVEFGFNSAELSAKAKEALRNIGSAMNREELINMRFEIAGHTCELGTKQYNQALSERRAQAVYDFLVRECSVNAERLMPKGYGEDLPLPPISDDPEINRSRNRRVEFKLIN